MKIRPNLDKSNIEIQSEVYQAKNGSFILNWGNDIILLNRKQSEGIAYDMPCFDKDKYNEFYKLILN